MTQIRDDYKFQYIDTATTTQVKTGQGQLVRILLGTSAAGAIEIRDNTSGTAADIGEIESSAAVGTYEFGVVFSTGLRITTGAATKITVVFV